MKTNLFFSRHLLHTLPPCACLRIATATAADKKVLKYGLIIFGVCFLCRRSSFGKNQAFTLYTIGSYCPPIVCGSLAISHSSDAIAACRSQDHNIQCSNSGNLDPNRSASHKCTAVQHALAAYPRIDSQNVNANKRAASETANMQDTAAMCRRCWRLRCPADSK